MLCIFHLIIMSTSSILSIIFTQMSHPLAMGLMLLLQTLMICLMTGFMTQSFWFSYILFLVFLGGLLVLFIYVTSLASNEMFSLSVSTLIFTSGPLLIILFIIMFLDPMPWLTSIISNDMNSISDMLNYQEESTISLMKLYNQPTGFITLMLVIYLFLTLIAVMKITNIFYGPLRQKN
uniref:NADH-ubiquinone oxidoreductase chain 6 n=2 Tax=Pteronarcella badia TaxID=466579 RepID=A0A0U2UW28_9NEOP|nr:NADH dehydrogenase subunit 6 [Pteronarcella badia]ALT66163.1 NADH dehydrogenase subunit 6 [Pteronarcella badia]